MLKIELVPDLTHCIETVTKREYRETLRQLLTAEGESEELQGRAELLGTFLAAADFRKLRQESEKYLVEGRKVTFVFYFGEGTPQYDMRVT